MTGHDSMLRMNRAEVEAAKRSFSPVNIPIGKFETATESWEYVYTQLLDTDLKPITIGRIVDSKHDLVKEQYNQPGWKGMKDGELTEEQMARQLKAVNECRLPRELIAYVLDHPEIDLDDYLPSENDPDTAIIGFTGWSRSGKSTMLGVLYFFMREQESQLIDVVSFDKISSANAEKYCKVLQSSPRVRQYIDEHPGREFDLREAVGIMCEEIANSYGPGGVLAAEMGDDNWTLNQALGNLMERFKTGKPRPQVILADMNGIRWQPEGVEQRPEHIFDEFQRECMTMVQVSRGIPGEQLRKVDLDPNEVFGYIYDLFRLGVGEATEVEERLKLAEFRSLVNQKEDPELDQMRELYANLSAYSEAMMQIASISKVVTDLW